MINKNMMRCLKIGSTKMKTKTMKIKHVISTKKNDRTKEINETKNKYKKTRAFVIWPQKNTVSNFYARLALRNRIKVDFRIVSLVKDSYTFESIHDFYSFLFPRHNTIQSKQDES